MNRNEILVSIPAPLFLNLANFFRECENKKEPVEAIVFAIENWLENLQALSSFLKEEDNDCCPIKALDLAVDYWIDNASWKPELLPDIKEAGKGYWWKEVFLPHETTLRMKYKGEYHYAKVVGDKIEFKEKIGASPSWIANTITKSSRNAWRDFEIKRPSDEQWNMATVLRREAKKKSKMTLEDLLP